MVHLFDALHRITLDENCWDMYINGKYINRLLMHAKLAHYGMCRKKFFISYVRIKHVDSLVSIETAV